MLICNCQSRKHLIIYSNVRIIQPFLGCLGIVFAALGVLKGLFLGSGCILVIYLVHPKYIYAAVSLNQLSVNLAIFQGSQSLYNSIIIRIGNILIIAVICENSSGQSTVSIINSLGSLTHVCCRILFQLVQDLLCLLLTGRDIIICKVISTDGNTYIAERRLLCFFICYVNLCLVADRIVNSLTIGLKLQKSLNLIFGNSKLLQSVLIIILHKLSCCICNSGLIISTNLNIIISCLLFHDVHQLNLLQELSYSLLAVCRTSVLIYYLAPDISCTSHEALIHGNGLCLGFTGIQAYNPHRNVCTIHSCNCLLSIYRLTSTAGKHSNCHYAT